MAVVRAATKRYGKKRPSPHDVLAEAFGDNTVAYRRHFRLVADLGRVPPQSTLECATCGGPLPASARKNKLYCSPACKPRNDHRTGEQKRCEHCAKVYNRRSNESLKKWGARRFCLPQCSIDAGASRPEGANSMSPTLRS
jgi:hypothetical protein